MMLRLAATAICLASTMANAAPAPAPLAGQWQVKAKFHSGSAASTMTLGVQAEQVTGTSGPLDEAGLFPLALKGELKDGRAKVQFL